MPILGRRAIQARRGLGRISGVPAERVWHRVGAIIGATAAGKGTKLG
jgi:hypothetical protein